MRAALANFVTVHWFAFTVIVLFAIGCGLELAKMLLTVLCGYAPGSFNQDDNRRPQ